MAEGLLGGMTDEDKYLGLLGIGLGMLAGNRGRSRGEAFSNAIGGGMQGGMGLLGPIQQNRQQQAQRALAEKKMGLEERQIGAYEAANRANATLHQAQAEALARQQRALENAFPTQSQGLLSPQQSPQSMIDAGQGAYMQTAPIMQQSISPQGVRPQIGLEKLLSLAKGGVNIEPYLKLREASLPKINDNVAYDPNTLTPGMILPGTTTTPQGQSIIRDVGGAVRNAPGSFEAQLQNKLPEALVNSAFAPPTLLGTNAQNQPILRNQEQARAAAGARDPLEILAPFLRQGVPSSQGPATSGERMAQSPVLGAPAMSRPVATTTGTPTGPTAEEQAIIKQRDTAKQEDTKLGAKQLENVQADSLAQVQTLQTLKKMRGLIDQGIVGPDPIGRARMSILHPLGAQSADTIRTANLRALGQQLVIAKAGGSLGTGVSTADAVRFDAAAGNFSKATSAEEMKQYIDIMESIAQQAFDRNQTQMDSFRRSGGQTPPLGTEGWKVRR